MTKDEAIAWAIQNLAEAFDYEFYQDKDKADFAAQAMTILSNNQWHVVSKHHCHWVVLVKDQSPA